MSVKPLDRGLGRCRELDLHQSRVGPLKLMRPPRPDAGKWHARGVDKRALNILSQRLHSFRKAYPTTLVCGHCGQYEIAREQSTTRQSNIRVAMEGASEGCMPGYSTTELRSAEDEKLALALDME